jgi:glutamate transport system permease protein
MLPAIISQLVVALKDTSLGAYILAPGLTRVGEALQQEFRNPLQTWTVVAAIYILMNLVLTWIATRIQKRLVGEKQQLTVPGDANSGASA